MDIRIAPNCIVTVSDGNGSCVIAGKTWRWDFDKYMGPMFLRKDGLPLRNQPGENHPVWDEFYKWHKALPASRK